jgi:hypothetical protein
VKFSITLGGVTRHFDTEGMPTPSVERVAEVEAWFEANDRYVHSPQFLEDVRREQEQWEQRKKGVTP